MTSKAHQVVAANVAEAAATLQQLVTLTPQIETASAMIAEALLSGHKLLACGNGGSAADASHLTPEFVSRYHRERRPYPAISLATHGGDLTAIANDYAFADIFARQVKAFAQPGDVLAVFTTTGASENVYRALATAKELNLKTIAFLGRDGGKCASLATVEFLVKGTLTARIQEAHKFLLHTLCELVEEQLPR